MRPLPRFENEQKYCAGKRRLRYGQLFSISLSRSLRAESLPTYLTLLEVTAQHVVARAPYENNMDARM